MFGGCGYTEMQVVNFKYIWVINNFSYCPTDTAKALDSPIFSITEKSPQQWRVKLYPGGSDKKYKDYLSVYLQLVSDEKSTIRGKFKISILKYGKTKVNVSESQMCNFTQQAYGFDNFIARDFLMDQDNNLLVEDMLKIHCEINVNAAELNYTSDITYTQTHEETSNARLLNNFQWLLVNEMLSDVLLVVGEKKFAAHKAILAARSTVFEWLFIDNLEQTEFEITDIDVDVMNMVLNFLYTGNADELGANIKEFVYAAMKYDFLDPELQSKCEIEMIKHINVLDAAELLAYSDDHFFEKLQWHAIKFIINHPKQVVKTSGYKAMADSHPHLVEKLFRALASKIHKDSL